MKSTMYLPEEISLKKMKKKRSTPTEDYSSDVKNTEFSPDEELLLEVPKDMKEEKEFGHGSNAAANDDDEEEEEQDEEEGGHDSNTNDVKEKQEGSSNRVATHGFHLVRGKMDHGMEDYTVAENRKIDGHDLGLYAIFDGHSGPQVAEHLQSHLFDNILSEPDFWRSPKAALKRAYKSTDDEILEKVVDSRGGSTAVTAILVDRKKLIVANVGDSRAILCRNGAAKLMTVDHDPQKEKDLVESRGGFVSERIGSAPRVDGQLAMTRAFGDAKIKEHVTSEPDVMIETIDDDIKFIILASDGLWKAMSNEEASDCIKDMDNAQEASEALIKEALSRKSLDDISCVVVKFH